MSESHPPPMPGWVKWLGAIFLAVILAAALLALVGGGDHGPWRHFSTDQN
ncbi:hypothetical protein [Devosia soli]|nr:hypothetical protein [Devosia soli]